MTWNILKFLPTEVLTGLPESRPKRPNRRDQGGFTGNVNAVPWRGAVAETLVHFGFPQESIENLLYQINDALSYREHMPYGVLREADEKEDLAELYVRLGDVLDSLKTMSNKTRLRIMDALDAVGLDLDPYDTQRPIRGLQWGVGKAFSDIGAVADRRGRPRYDDARETPFLAMLIRIWFEQFRWDLGVRRRGDYVEAGCAEYEGRLLDFLVRMFNAVQIQAGSSAAIGKRALRLQERIEDDLVKSGGVENQDPEA
jgi:hypothetical protein